MISKWAEEQEAIDKFGEITLGCEGQDVKDLASAITEYIEKGVGEMKQNIDTGVRRNEYDIWNSCRELGYNTAKSEILKRLEGGS